MKRLAQEVEREESSVRTLIDVGAGTGISSRALRDAFGPGFTIIGIEPSDGMRNTAVEETAAETNITYIDGNAEALPASACSARLVFVGQAIQWFDRERFYREVDRVLTRCGVLGIVQNNRLWSSSALLDEYENILERMSPGYSRYYRSFNIEAELSRLPLLTKIRTFRETWALDVNAEAFLGLSMSSTKMKAAVEAHGRNAMETMVNDLFARHAHASQGLSLQLPYETELFAAVKK